MLWINFLHFYQPANIGSNKILEATEKSYERILRALEEHPQIKFTFNLSGCLLMRLNNELKRQDLIKRIDRLIKKDQIELTGSAAYHPILPLINYQIAIEQIKENENILKKYFGQNLKLTGFYLPEMAYSPQIATLIKNLNYRWIILDEISLVEKTKINPRKKYQDKKNNLNIIFRNKKYSQSYPPEKLLKNISQDETIITATDAELYGLRHLDETGNFENILKNSNLKTLTISSYLKNLKKNNFINLKKSSWESTEEELKNNNPFKLWKDPKNILQIKLWELADLAQKIYLKYPKDFNYWWSYWHMVRGLASCTFWWASAQNLSHVFGPIAWHPDQVELGAQELIRSIRDLNQSTNLKEKIKAENIYTEIIKLIWITHWKYSFASQ